MLTSARVRVKWFNDCYNTVNRLVKVVLGYAQGARINERREVMRTTDKNKAKKEERTNKGNGFKFLTTESIQCKNFHKLLLEIAHKEMKKRSSPYLYLA